MVNYFDKYIKYKDKYLNSTKNTGKKYIQGGGKVINIYNYCDQLTLALTIDIGIDN